MYKGLEMESLRLFDGEGGAVTLLKIMKYTVL